MEIELRAWQKWHKMMLKVLEIGWDDGKMVKVTVKYPEGTVPRVITYSTISDDFNLYKDGVCNLVLMQYTGLKDSNGTKIYDGDIVRYAHKDWDCYELSVVSYEIEHSYPAFDLKNHDFDCNAFSGMFESRDYEIEVIGNIHDNPEFLQ